MIIVTGGAGFVGSNLVRGLNRRGVDDILVVDDLENGEKHRNLNALDYLDLVDWRDFGADPARYVSGTLEALIHQGACSDTMVHDGRAMLAANHEASKRMLELALGRCPFLYASSAAVYGDGARGFREELACEDPLNVYGYSKHLFDRHVRRVLPRARTQVVGLRYFNVYGPQEAHKGRMASVVHQFHRQIQAGGALRVFAGSEGFRRDFVFVDDCVAVNLHFLDEGRTSGVFNCGSGRAESFLDLARAAAGHYPGARIEEVPFPDALVGKYQAYTQADLGALRAAGYEREFTPLADGVASYVRVLQQSDGYYRREGAA